MIFSTTEYVNGELPKETIGLISGTTVRAKHVGRDMMASLKMVFGGEVKGYTKLMEEGKQQALSRLKAKAEELGANAIVGLRFEQGSLAQGATEISVYGTAVKI